MTEEEKNCIEQALRFLSLREHNKAELKTKLKAKGYEDSTINTTISFLIKDGSLDEERYIRVFVRSNNKRHPEGKSILYQRLIQKGADKEKVREVLEDIYTEEYIRELTQEAKEKLIKRGKATDSKALKALLYKAGLSDKYL